MTKEFNLTIDLDHPDAQRYGSIASILQSAASHFISDIEDWNAAPEDSHGTIRTLHGEPAFWEITGVTKDPRDLLLDEYVEFVRATAKQGQPVPLFDQWRDAKLNPIKHADSRYVWGVSEVEDDFTDAEWIESAGEDPETAHQDQIEAAIAHHELMVAQEQDEFNAEPETDDEPQWAEYYGRGDIPFEPED